MSAPQLGKSLTLGLWLLAGAWQDAGKCAEWPSWWAAPTYEQARSGFLRYICRPAVNAGILEPNKYTTTVPLRAELMNGSVIEARSWDKPEGLYGPTVARIAVDEFGLLTDSAWAALSSRTTETAIHGKGYIRMAGNVSDVGGTAERLYLTAINGYPGWAARTWTWRDRATAAPCDCDLGIEIETAHDHGARCERGVYLRDLAARSAVMSEAHFRQLYGAEWLDWSSLPVYQFDRSIHVTADVTEDAHLPIDLAVDFNVDPMAWVIGQHNTSEAWVLDVIAIPGGATTEMACDEFLRRYPGSPHRQLNVYGDASGKSRSTKSTLTDYQIIRNKIGPSWPNLTVKVPEANPPVTDRINSYNALLKSGSGVVRYYVHPRAERLATDLARVSYKPGTREIDKAKDRTLTHFSDADGYRVVYEFPVTGRSVVAVSGLAESLDADGGVQAFEMEW